MLHVWSIGKRRVAYQTDDFEFDRGGSTIEVNPTNTTTCVQQINQAASASG